MRVHHHWLLEREHLPCMHPALIEPVKASSVRLWASLLRWVLGARMAILVLVFVILQIERALSCNDVRVNIESPKPSMAPEICTAATHAINQLKACGVELKRPLSIKIAEDAGRDGGAGAYGCYQKGTERIQLLPFEQCAERLRRDKERSGLDAADYFRSVVVHEVVHAVLAQQTQFGELSTIVHEYLAYALQIDSMQPESREAMLRPVRLPKGTAPQPPHEILLFMSPATFGAQAYFHFKSQPSTCTALDDMLTGRLVLPRISE